MPRPARPVGMELVKLHVLQRKSLAEHDADAVAGQRVRVGGGLVHPARTAGGEHHGLGVEDVDLAGGQLVGDHAGGHRAVRGLGQHQVQRVELVEELHVVLDAVLVERLQDHVAGAVGGVARPAHRGLAVIAGVPAEAALVDATFRGAVERHPHLLQVEHGVDGLLAHDLHRVLVGQVVAALDGVEGVPFPVVVFDVGQRGAHAALRGAGVAAGGVELGQHRGADPGPGLDGRPHPGAARTDDHHVISVLLDHRSASDVGVEGHQHVGAEHQREAHRQQQQAVEPEPGAVLAAVVIDDGAQAVAAVQLRQPQ